MSDSDIEYRILEAQDFTTTMEFILENFATKEPTTFHLNIQRGTFEEYFSPLIKTAISYGVSIGVYKKSSGEMCAVRINLLGGMEKPILPPFENQPLEMKQLLVFLKSIHKKELCEEFGSDHYLELFLTAVRQDFTNRGIATHLYKRTEELAKKNSCLYLSVICTSAFTIMATTKLGYKQRGNVSYHEYIDPLTGNKIFEKIQEPHKICAWMVKDID
uniref:uncharacterized protein LOC120345071 n=1 Tax=Styela clava TaxID=7725 RepID=UPI00193A3B9E|nr:uncharacterized protein LOC120345071 [Styela clava]